MFPTFRLIPCIAPSFLFSLHIHYRYSYANVNTSCANRKKTTSVVFKIILDWFDVLHLFLQSAFYYSRKLCGSDNCNCQRYTCHEPCLIHWWKTYNPNQQHTYYYPCRYSLSCFFSFKCGLFSFSIGLLYIIRIAMPRIINNIHFPIIRLCDIIPSRTISVLIILYNSSIIHSF